MKKIQFSNKEKEYLYDYSNKFIRITTGVEHPYLGDDYPVKWASYNNYFGYIVQELKNEKK